MCSSDLLVFVPWLAHAGLALSIGLGAWVNALWLWWGLKRRGWYQPAPGWLRFLAQIGVSSALLAWFLGWVSGQFNWVGMQDQPWHRVGGLLLILLASVLLYFGVLRMLGLKWRALLRI